MKKKKKLTRKRAIRLKCLECCCQSAPEVRRCEMKDCPLWRFRMGTEIEVMELYSREM